MTDTSYLKTQLTQTTLLKKNNFIRRLLVLILGLVIMGIGVALFELSLLGNDSCTAFAFGIGNIFKKNLAVGLLILNGACFVFELLFARDMIGIGTFLNWFCVGSIEIFWKDVLTSLFTFPENFVGRFLVMLLGVIVLSLSVALYQTPSLGVAPYDAISIHMSRKLPIKYFWCRITTDALCAIGAFFTGSIVSVGTIVCALGLGPFISFFTRIAAGPLCGIKKD